MKEKIETFPFSGFVEKVDSQASPERDESDVPKWIVYRYTIEGKIYSSFNKFEIDTGEYVKGEAYMKGKYMNIDSMEKSDPTTETIPPIMQSTQGTTSTTFTVDAGEWKKKKENSYFDTQSSICRQNALTNSVKWVMGLLKAGLIKDKKEVTDLLISTRIEFARWNIEGDINAENVK